MNTNVINPSVEIYGGKLSIIGQNQFTVVIMATGLRMVGDVRLDKLAETWIKTRLLGDQSDTVIFEYNLRSELRNPHKLLKSIRSKLMHLMNVAHSEFDQEWSDLEWQMDMAMHHPGRCRS